jgi:amino acid transporter
MELLTEDRHADLMAPTGPAPPRATVDLPPQRLGYRVKCKLLGVPLPTEQLAHQRLGKPTALAVFASDNLSSSAYATEEILRVLVPAVGLAAFSLVVPLTVAMLGVLALLILSYRETIKAYPTAGGAYVVTRDNFGLLPAQVAGVALLTDYVLTVSVSVAAGTAALTSAFPALTGYTVPLSVSFIGVVAYGNLRGVRESGRVFAVPTYFFITNMVVLLGAGLWRAWMGGLPEAQVAEGMLAFGDAGDGVLLGASLFVVLHAFASGGAAVTGVEAISNGVPAFRPPAWRNARSTLVIMGTTLGVMFLGLSALAGRMHVTPYDEGTPTVLSQIAQLVYGPGPFGQALYYALQAGTMLILVLAANTSFADFPRLASFQAGDNFLPRQLTRRGHRLVFSNGIVALALTAIALVVVTGAKVDRLIPLYAIGVFTSFTLSQAGMARHHLTRKEPGWRRGLLVNGVGAGLSLLVDVVIGVTKFTHGAWLVVALVPVLVALLVRLARQYETEAHQLERDVPAATMARILRRHVVLVFVDRLDLAAARAIQYARTLTPDDLRVVHFALDPQRAEELGRDWQHFGLASVPLEVVDCPDRRLTRAAVEIVGRELATGETEVSVLLPDRKYRGVWHRILHDQTAGAIARDVSRLPHANVTTVPFHVESQRTLRRRQRPTPVAVAPTPCADGKQAGPGPPAAPGAAPAEVFEAAGAPGSDLADAGSDLVDIGSVRGREHVRVAGRVETIRILPMAGVQTLECVLSDGTGRLSLVFFRPRVAGIETGVRLIAEGTAGEHRGRLAIFNPVYDFLPERRGG